MKRYGRVVLCTLGCIWKKWTDDTKVPADFTAFFNQVTPENEGKWERAKPLRGQYQWAVLDAMHDFSTRNNFKVKHHTLVWGSQQPPWTDSLGSEKEAKAEVENWIKTFFERYGAKTDMIDVVNEPIHVVPKYAKWLGDSGTTGWDWVIWTFETARKYVPKDCKLILNDYDLLKSSSNTNKIVTIANLLKTRGLIDGIGAQSHFLESTTAATVKSNLDKLASVGVPIYISELDLDIADDNKHLEAYKRLFPVFWEHPNVAGVTLWGYMEGAMWHMNGYLIRKDGSDRPAMKWLREYLKPKTTSHLTIIPLRNDKMHMPAAASPWNSQYRPEWILGKNSEEILGLIRGR